MARSTFQEVVRHTQPAFTAYEKSLVYWMKRDLAIPRGDEYLIPVVEYAGGERAIRAVRALKERDGGAGESRNKRHRQPIITIKMNDVQYFQERYHPPESTWKTIYNSPDKTKSTRAARISKPAPYKITYAVDIYALYEVDLRFMMGQFLLKFHHHGGLGYLSFFHPTAEKNLQQANGQIFPVYLRSFSNNTDSNTGDEERTVRASAAIEVEAYLPLPYHFVPIFRKLTLFTETGGEAERDVAIINVLDSGIAERLRIGEISKEEAYELSGFNDFFKDTPDIDNEYVALKMKGGDVAEV